MILFSSYVAVCKTSSFYHLVIWYVVSDENKLMHGSLFCFNFSCQFHVMIPSSLTLLPHTVEDTAVRLHYCPIHLKIPQFAHITATCTWRYFSWLTLLPHTLEDTAVHSHYCHIHLKILQFAHITATYTWRYWSSLTLLPNTLEDTAKIMV